MVPAECVVFVLKYHPYTRSLSPETSTSDSIPYILCSFAVSPPDAVESKSRRSAVCVLSVVRASLQVAL